ncbi:MAG: MFS transporter [Clostridia bacterium]|nr:MFS transporter [Clostridia bacterium]MBN2884263.1 MFS transporter [Clostridia bacterium]
MSDTPKKLWNKNFILLVQGRFVSLFGSVLFSVALGFWVLDKTGSGTLMGTIMAASALPRILISPFAGPLVDRWRKNRILVWSDLINGIVVLAATVIIYMNLLEVWMVFIVAIVSGIASAFFSPASTAIIPDLIPPEKMTNAGSINSMINSATEILATPAGGFLYTAFGAPLLFLLDGVSYILSAISEMFIKTKHHDHNDAAEYSYWTDFREGIRYALSNVGIRNFFFLAAFMNFMLNAAIVTLMPYFQRTEGLGPEKYGFAMSVFTIGMFMGGLIMSLVRITNKNRLTIEILGIAISLIAFAISLLFGYTWTLILFFIGGLMIVVVNVIIGAVLQLVIEPKKRGKFFAFSSSISAGLTPLGMAMGGIMSDSFSIPHIMLIFNLITLAVFLGVMTISAKTRAMFHIESEETQPVVNPEN